MLKYIGRTAMYKTIALKKIIKIATGCIALIMVFFIASGCSCENTKMGASNLGSSNIPSQASSSSENVSGQPDGNFATGQSGTTPKAAVRIDRGGENYDYSDWELTAPMPDCLLYVNPAWSYENLNYGGKWAVNGEDSAEITYQWLIDLKGSPQEEIQKQYGSIINNGNGVEYGVFKSNYLAEAYYCKYQESGYTYISLYGWYYPEDFAKKGGGQTLIVALSYKGKSDMQGGSVTLNEEDYWKVAQGMYIAQGAEGNTPYIPPQS